MSQGIYNCLFIGNKQNCKHILKLSANYAAKKYSLQEEAVAHHYTRLARGEESERQNPEDSDEENL